MGTMIGIGLSPCLPPCTGAGNGPSGSALLLEDGFYLLLEDGFYLLLE